VYINTQSNAANDYTEMVKITVADSTGDEAQCQLAIDVDIIDTNPIGVVIADKLVDLNNAESDMLNLDLALVSDLLDDDHNLVYIGENGDAIDFNDNENWALKSENVKIDGEDESVFNEYTNTNNPNISVFIEDAISVDI
ncbi:MAG: hypothetical protein U9N30_10870, partial [Campylobacterota bacterium]|nr:hypothetical protein [Campylobacterota bacterium]